MKQKPAALIIALIISLLSQICCVAVEEPNTVAVITLRDTGITYEQAKSFAPKGINKIKILSDDPQTGKVFEIALEPAPGVCVDDICGALAGDARVGRVLITDSEHLNAELRKNYAVTFQSALDIKEISLLLQSSELFGGVETVNGKASGKTKDFRAYLSEPNRENANKALDFLNGNNEISAVSVNAPVISEQYEFNILGDADGDGKISAADAAIALRAAVGNVPAEDDAELFFRFFNASDLNGDGKITAADARIILRASVGLYK